MAVLNISVIFLKTLSWRQRYLSSLNASGQPLSTCWSDALPGHNLQMGVSIFPHLWRFTGLGSTSYTDMIWNLVCVKSFHKMSTHQHNIPRSILASPSECCNFIFCHSVTGITFKTTRWSNQKCSFLLWSSFIITCFGSVQIRTTERNVLRYSSDLGGWCAFFA